jgi:hypothetical protein
LLGGAREWREARGSGRSRCAEDMYLLASNRELVGRFIEKYD